MCSLLQLLQHFPLLLSSPLLQFTVGNRFTKGLGITGETVPYKSSSAIRETATGTTSMRQRSSQPQLA